MTYIGFMFTVSSSSKDSESEQLGIQRVLSLSHYLHFDPGEVVADLVVLPHEEVEAGGGLGAHGGDGGGTVAQQRLQQIRSTTSPPALQLF